jgi:putative transposase
MRGVLAHVPQSERGAVAEELRRCLWRGGGARRISGPGVRRALPRTGLSGRWRLFAQGLGEALTSLDFPSGHQRHVKSTNVLERLIREVKRRTRVVGVFPGEGSLVNLATVVMLRATEDWAFRRYLDMGPLLGRGRETHKNRDLTGLPGLGPRTFVPRRISRMNLSIRLALRKYGQSTLG